MRSVHAVFNSLKQQRPPLRALIFLFLALLLTASTFALPQLPDGRRILPPPPARGSAAEALDMAVFTQTRALQGTERWALAIRDDRLSPAHILEAFSCAAGMRMDARKTPRLAALLGTYRDALRPVVSAEKNDWKRPRPYAQSDAPVCLDTFDKYRLGYSYPSGHATFSWAAASLLAELMPDRAAAIFQRARVFGESRIVCGAHWKSDVQAGWLNGAFMFRALQADRSISSRMRAVKREVAEARRTPQSPDPQSCAVEQAAANMRIE